MVSTVLTDDADGEGDTELRATELQELQVCYETAIDGDWTKVLRSCWRKGELEQRVLQAQQAEEVLQVRQQEVKDTWAA